MALLLYGRRLGVALRHNDTAEVAAIFAGNLLPDGLALVSAEGDFPIRLSRIQEDPPTIVGHLDIAELRPAFLIDAGRGTQVDVVVMRALGPHLPPPLEELG